MITILFYSCAALIMALVLPLAILWVSLFTYLQVMHLLCQYRVARWHSRERRERVQRMNIKTSGEKLIQALKNGWQLLKFSYELEHPLHVTCREFHDGQTLEISNIGQQGEKQTVFLGSSVYSTQMKYTLQAKGKVILKDVNDVYIEKCQSVEVFQCEKEVTMSDATGHYHLTALQLHDGSWNTCRFEQYPDISS